MDVPIWELRTGRIVRVLEASPAATGYFTPDSRFLIVAEPRSRCRVFTSEDWRLAWELQGGRGVAIDPQGRYLAVGRAPNNIQIVLMDGTRVAQFDAASGVKAFSPDGAFLVGHVYSGPQVHLWNLRSIRAELARLGMDWNLPPLPRPSAPPKKTSEFTVDLGRLAGKFDRSKREARATTALGRRLGAFLRQAKTVLEEAGISTEAPEPPEPPGPAGEETEDADGREDVSGERTRRRKT